MRLILSVLATLLLSSAVHAAQCGGSFDSFVNGLKSEARDLGYSDRQVNSFFSGVAQDPKVIKADRSQGVFQLPFMEFSAEAPEQPTSQRKQCPQFQKQLSGEWTAGDASRKRS